jgi:hypothetical protein
LCSFVCLVLCVLRAMRRYALLFSCLGERLSLPSPPLPCLPRQPSRFSSLMFPLSVCLRYLSHYLQVFALGYNMTAIPLASGALFPLTHVRLHPAVAGLCMALSSVSVVVSSLLLRRYRPPLLPSLASVCDDSGRDGAVWDVEGAEGSWAWRRMLWGTHRDVKDQRVGCSLDGEQSRGKEKRGRADAMATLRPSVVAAKVRGYSQIASGAAS